ncbi:TlpA disulfide reductase family protein [Pedobacter metabolipauper]|uniref:Peroxiredoxin n=1 Tax=Pedobacter metabolipauper TaxID=425513 RepID=A0A4R6SYL5_9SPHI|nr:TlpA disulfide reductase family protein [Pedobacter metabolipauper]TDQ11157.1 peroxiredoxin [Pedobacter metabolipauper]
MQIQKIKSRLYKKACLTVLSPFLIIGMASAQKSGTYEVTGKLDGLGNEMVYLTGDYDGKKLADSVLAANGAFTFKGTTPGALFYGLRFGKNKYMALPLDVNEKVQITGNINNLAAADVKGAKMLPVWKEWTKGWGAITARAGQLYQILDSVNKVGKDGDRSYADAEFKKLDQRLVDSVESFVKKHPESPVSAYVIIDRFINYPNPEKAASTYAALAPAAKNSIYGKQLGESLRISAKTGIGMKPDFTLPDRDGKPLKLSSLKGKVVLVDFWASWCGPCRKENPNLVKAYAKYHDKGFEIVGVSLDDKKENWLKAIDADKLTWLHASDLKGWKSDLAAEYGIKSIPASFLVDADGKIIAKSLRGEDLEKKLASIFK